jgi:hypothetical protein
MSRFEPFSPYRDSVFVNNVAHGGEGGGARFFGRPTRVTRVVFSNNTVSFGSGCGAVVGSGILANFHNCTFSARRVCVLAVETVLIR